MNLGQLEASFRTDTDDAATPYLWSSEEVTRWFNEAVNEACIRGKLIFEKTNSRICHIAVTAAAGSVYKLHEAVNEIVYATLTDSNGCITQIGLLDRDELDRIDPSWRTNTGIPSNLIHRDNSIEFDSVPLESYTLKLEVHRLPLCEMAKEGDKPEINQVHHIHLVNWAKHRAYLKPDSDSYNPGKASECEEKFTDYFGERPNSDMRKAENANLPHVNKGYW